MKVEDLESVNIITINIIFHVKFTGYTPSKSSSLKINLENFQNILRTSEELLKNLEENNGKTLPNLEEA